MKQMTLGALIEILRHKDQADEVRFDFAYFAPTNLHSYRGDYKDLAFGYSDDSRPLVATVLRTCQEMLYQLIQGYKGGSYTITEETVLWVARESEATRTAIVDVKDQEGLIVLCTTRIPG